MLVFLSIILGLLSGINVGDALPRSSNGRIVNGEPIAITDAPHMVAVLKDSFEGYFKHACAGTIVAPRTILTAATCVRSARDDEIRVRYGSTFHNGSGTVVGIAGKLIHPDFSFMDSESDLALLFLQTALQTSGSVATMRLARQNEAFEVGVNATVTGWGYEGDNTHAKTPDLRRARMKTVGRDSCLGHYDFNITEQHLCAISRRPGPNAADVCDDDYGDPLVVGDEPGVAVAERVQIGLMSWGQMCLDPEAPTVYTRVASFRQWIDANMRV